MVFERVVSTPNPQMSHEVLYIGSAVPLETSVGLEAVQQPLRARYPVDNDETIQGVLSTVVIVPEGIQLRFQGEDSPPILFLFSSLSMCAAVRCVKVTDSSTGQTSPRFVPLASPQAGGVNSSKPAIFTAITRRTKGRQVLECHGFVTNTPKDALDLVQWTCSMDRRSKTSGVTTGHSGVNNFGQGIASPSAQRFDGDMSFRASDTSSIPDFPIQIKPADNFVTHVNAAPAGPLPEHSSKDGYFYSTKNTQVKRYSLQRFHGSSGVDDTPSLIGPGADQFMRRPASAYASSHVSAPASHHHHHYHLHASQQHQHKHFEPVMYPPPPPPGMIYPVGGRPVPPPMMAPMRAMRPPLMRPVYVVPPPPPYINQRSPRFFSPPPGLRARPVPMYLVPPGEMPATLPRPVRTGRRGSRGSSHSSTDHSSSPSPARVNGKANGGKKHHAQERGASSDGSSSRPQTPPTDYEGAARGPRVSRRDDFLMRERNGFATLPPPGAGVYMMPPYSFYPPPPGAYQRARSQPPVDRKSKKKEKKSKKSHKKLSRKSSAKNGGSRHQHDMYESTDSVGGYQSEMLTGSKANTENRKPRDFMRMENQFQHERAFSKSLAEETRKSTGGELSTMNNAYSLTDIGHTDGVPGTTGREGQVARDGEGFPHLY
ncbi:serine/arginine repetitive matrix protein 1-like [Elysia marginata]|uniref:Serine/arginine repetitive matrix protein 1-like n=1 Tax=Elysia marginata TaxID=1093978 RepID=A0AAV4H9U0_9GAST|nr:serine/arginine repetitive matrix protein 1-like [Elysia marginata]